MPIIPLYLNIYFPHVIRVCVSHRIYFKQCVQVNKDINLSDVLEPCVIFLIHSKKVIYVQNNEIFKI